MTRSAAKTKRRTRKRRYTKGELRKRRYTKDGHGRDNTPKENCAQSQGDKDHTRAKTVDRQICCVHDAGTPVDPARLGRQTIWVEEGGKPLDAWSNITVAALGRRVVPVSRVVAGAMKLKISEGAGTLKDGRGLGSSGS